MSDLPALTAVVAAMVPRRREGEYVFVPGADAGAVARARAMVVEDEGMSLVLNRADADAMGLAYDFVGAWITLEVPSSLEIVGLTAAVSGELVVRGIGCNAIAGLRHGHLLVPARRAPAAMHALRRMAAAASASLTAEEGQAALVAGTRSADVGRHAGPGMPDARSAPGRRAGVDAAARQAALHASATPVLPSIVINGTVGVGKTSVTHAVGALLASRRVPHAVIDVDELRRVWPPPSDDRFQRALELRNLSRLVTVDRAAGAHVIVVAGVVETDDARREYQAVLGESVVVRLTAAPEVVLERLERRHSVDPDDIGLEWHRARAPELAGALAAAHVDDVVVETDELTPREVAVRIVAAWDQRRAAPDRGTTDAADAGTGAGAGAGADAGADADADPGAGPTSGPHPAAPTTTPGDDRLPPDRLRAGGIGHGASDA